MNTEEYAIYTQNGCPKCQILAAAMYKAGLNYKENDLPEEDNNYIYKYAVVYGLPVLQTPMGILYRFSDAMRLIDNIVKNKDKDSK